MIQLEKVINMFIRLGALFLFVLCCAQSVCVASSKEDALQFDIPVVQGVEKYLNLLEYPSYLAVALENNAIKVSNAGRPTLIDERTIQFKSAMLRFSEKKDAVYVYETSLEWDIQLKHLKFEVPVEIDTSSVSTGNISIRVFVPLASLFPDALVERIKIKIQMLSGAETQMRMLSYFDEVSKQSGSASGLQGLFSRVMLQSFSLHVDSDGGCAYAREPGDAESLSDQAYLLVTLAIWLIIGPASIAAFFVWQNRKNRNL